MKKNILIFSSVLLALSLGAFSFIDHNNSSNDHAEVPEAEVRVFDKPAPEKVKNRIFEDFIYDIGPRFGPIKKGDLDKARSFSDFIGDDHAQRIVAYKSLKVIILINDEQSNIVKTGKSGDFTAEQLDFLQSLDYSTNLMIWADYREKNVTTGKIEDHHWTPYLTIVPEKQAEYESGKESLMTYLKENSKNSRASVDPDNLQPAKLYFTVTKEGAIKNVRLDRSSNYPSVDERMIELITNAPGKWKPAENSEGEKVDQELVISFGLMGC